MSPFTRTFLDAIRSHRLDRASPRLGLYVGELHVVGDRHQGPAHRQPADVEIEVEPPEAEDLPSPHAGVRLILELDDGVENPLPAIAEARAFQPQMAGWVSVPPAPQPVTVVGSYRLFAPPRVRCDGPSGDHHVHGLRRRDPCGGRGPGLHRHRRPRLLRTRGARTGSAIPPRADHPNRGLLQILDEYYRGYQDSRWVLDVDGLASRGRESSAGMVLVDGQFVGRMRRTLGTESVMFGSICAEPWPMTSVRVSTMLRNATAGSFASNRRS